jgi:hypothetical protein
VEDLLFHLVASAGPAAAWAAGFSAVVIAAFVVYVGIAMVVVLRTDDVHKAEIRYRVFVTCWGCSAGGGGERAGVGGFTAGAPAVLPT